jgi:hypothetical protein
MAVKSRKSSFWQSVHFLARFFGLSGALAACVGAFIWQILGNEEIGSIVVTLGLSAVAFGLLFELRGVAKTVSSRRGAFGLNVVLQIVVLMALVVGVNVFSFEKYRRFDMTSKKIFTLDKAIADQLAQLRGDTEIIVLQQYVSFGQRAEYKQDKYDFAAQRKIVEKVKDLAEQFKDFGPKFHVTVLDVQDDYYQEKLDKIRKLSPDLAAAIEKAPENSIFFYAKEHNQIQRLSFNDIYQLDKESSIDGNNLVLKYQGVGPFARKIFNIEEKKPRVALAVVHPYLGLQNAEQPMFTMAGAKKILDAYGFDSGDIVLRKLSEEGDLTDEPDALTYDESRYEQIEDDLAATDDALTENQKQLDNANEMYKFWSESSLAVLNKKFAYVTLPDGREVVLLRSQVDGFKKKGVKFRDVIDVDEVDRKNETADYKQDIEILKHVLESQREDKASLLKEKQSLKAESLTEKRRLNDMEGKMKAVLANVDLLIVPRFTLMNAPSKRTIPNRLHRLDAAQLKAMKAFLKEGKPILFLLGPTNMPGEVPDFDGGGGADQLEAMLAEIGFKLPKQTILYNIEAKEFHARKFGGEFDRSKRELDVPGLKFDDSTVTFQAGKLKQALTPHPLRTSLKLTSRTIGSKKGQEVGVRHPRPVYFLRSAAPEGPASLVGRLALPDVTSRLGAAGAWLNKAQQKPDENAVFLLTREECWNENNPYITKSREPRYTPAKDDDPTKGTIEEERRGPFPIGVAVEAQLPASWYDDGKAKPQKTRVAVIGSGNVFVGPSLPPLKEKMLLDVVNWLMGRDDLLAHEVDTWQYPRVPIRQDSVAFDLWAWGARLGLPLVFIYLGIVVWMVRRMR